MMKNKKPVIRFKGFSEEWEEKELKDIAIIKTGYPFDSNDFDNNGEYLVITNGNIQNDLPHVDGSFGNRIDFNNNASLSAYILNRNDTLVTMDGTVGRTAKVVEQKQILAQRVGRLTAKLEPEFLYQFLNTGKFFKEMSMIAHGGTIKHISLTEICDYKAYVPFYVEEQTQIGNFFKNLDNLITLHQQKYDKTVNVKKAMLEKMFPKNGTDVPEIRFKGFSGAWEEKTLGDLFGITSASRVHKHEWRESGVPFFRSSDVVSDYKGQENTKAFISFELYEELAKKSGCVQKNDILVTGGGSIGIPYLVKSNEPLYFKDADLLWLKNSDNMNGYFLYTFFSTSIFRSYVSSITHIGTISHYTIEQAKATPIKVPIREEQDKIGEYLTNLDKLLTLSQGELRKLKNLKKAMLEKMFI